MMGNKGKKLEDLLEVARVHRPDVGPVENQFQIRVMARIAEIGGTPVKAWWMWDLWTWRLVPVFFTVAILLGVGGVFASVYSTDIFTSFNNGYEDYLVTTMLAGG